MCGEWLDCYTESEALSDADDDDNDKLSYQEMMCVL